MNNPIEMIKSFVSNGATPQQVIQQMMNNANPMIANLIQMAQSGDKQGVENFARNMYRDKGRDFDKEFSDFMNNFK